MRIVGGVALVLAIGCGPGDLFVNASVGLDDSCKVEADDEHAVERPVFDIAPGAIEGSDACEDPFVAQLWVENPSDERARVNSAEIRLTSLEGQTILFNASDPPVPNPFLSTTASPLPASSSGVVELEVIPVLYAPALALFAGATIEAQITLFGETASGDELESERFVLPIEICDGCRSLCASDEAAEDAACSATELGPLRTFCIDPEC